MTDIDWKSRALLAESELAQARAEAAVLLEALFPFANETADPAFRHDWAHEHLRVDNGVWRDGTTRKTYIMAVTFGDFEKAQEVFTRRKATQAAALLAELSTLRDSTRAVGEGETCLSAEEDAIGHDATS